MLHKIWISLLYGSKKTRSLILSVAVFFLLAAACIAALIITHSVLWALGGVFAIIMAVIIMTSVSFWDSGKTVADKKPGTQNKQDSEMEQEEQEEKSNISAIRQSDIRQILVANKVKKDHMTVLIDSSDKYQIRQCPAYIWTDKSDFYILLLEKQARRIKIPKSILTKITYKPGVIARKQTEYPDLQKPSFVSLTFNGLLPTYYEEIDRSRTVYRKNLYVLEPDIMFTNNSIRPVMQVLGLDVTIEDKIVRLGQYSDYFKEAYKINILWKDGVYSTAEFKGKIKSMLRQMAEAEISASAFQEAIEQMIKGRLITKEYAEYYIDYRQKQAAQKVKKRR